MKKLSMRGRQAFAGWMFILPWVIGLVYFFLQPVITFLSFSFFEFSMGRGGGYELSPLEGGPFAHYIYAWTSDVNYPPKFTGAFEFFIYAVPIIVVFSLFIAILLNQEFKGRGLVRAIFFLPVIVTTGVFGTTMASGMGSIDMGTTSGASNIFDVTLLTSFLLNSGIPQAVVEPLTGMVSNVASLIWKSGIQILIFLIGLLSIPESYYEAAKVEGATGWEIFWKITFPVISPFILANLVYTFITECMSSTNGVINYCLAIAQEGFDYAFASAMMWMYFIVILLIVAAIFLIGSKMVAKNSR